MTLYAACRDLIEAADRHRETWDLLCPHGKDYSHTDSDCPAIQWSLKDNESRTAFLVLAEAVHEIESMP